MNIGLIMASNLRKMSSQGYQMYLGFELDEDQPGKSTYFKLVEYTYLKLVILRNVLNQGAIDLIQPRFDCAVYKL